MTPRQQMAMRALEHAGRKWLSAAEIGVRSAEMAPLVRKGLVRSAKQKQRPIHEPVSSWTVYTLPAEGWA